MRFFQVFALITALFTLQPAQADVLPTDGTPVHFGKAYAYPTVPARPNGAVFVKVKNLTDHDVKIVSASSPIAKRVELHTHAMVDGRMSMYPVDYVTVPAHETHELKPTGDHVMLMLLDAPLKVGDLFPVTFMLDDGSSYTIDASVISLVQ